MKVSLSHFCRVAQDDFSSTFCSEIEFKAILEPPRNVIAVFDQCLSMFEQHLEKKDI